ncbi:D-3-phosphoglycerate dehydrogenase [Flavobacterium cutihirudinis]|uniref:D-3-phosphoglycerate dehydrogenase n=1 Tax=Flavobacterium cutihirudinis TaxID=1265740 RepID=A0A3D9FKG9_9FLAO|nr:NAD(P)-dependent oxidoreductase [Flavobacterium cutihirudinis]RED19568.1 D-3-phosphoglycerate dehydrogenase [Flavobacterium cutihirudinis]
MTIGKKKLLITESDNFSVKALTILNEFFQVKIGRIENREELKLEIADADIIFVRLGFVIDKEIISKATNLKFILTATTGLDHIDTNYFESVGGEVISLKGEVGFLKSIPSTAEHTWGLLIALLKRIPSAYDHVKNGGWDRNLYINTNLKGKKIGILGFGRVGTQVANFAKAFDMEVGFFDVKDIDSQFVKFYAPEEMFDWADIISLHIPFSLENKKIVNKNLLSYINKEAVLINTSRGGIWDEDEVARLIKCGQIKGVATDVLENELYAESILSNPLVELSKQNFNIIITPHIAGATKESMEMTEEFIVEKFLQKWIVL